MDKELPVSAWPEWKIIEKIGEGSFGKVYKAQRTERGKSFYSAIKIINIPGSQSELNSVRSETGDEQSTRQYFQNLVEECIQEISTMEYFRGNSYIVSVEDFKVMEYLDVIGWEISIRMEYLTSFMDYCAEKQLTEKEVIKLGMDLSKALEYCRKLKIIHRDIKPENIFVSRFGDFKLGDFGIARELERTMSGFSKKGTYSYMAPEMYKGEKYDSRVDIYSLGIVLYRLMNHNRLPFMSLEKQFITYRDKENALNKRVAGEQMSAPVDAGTQFARIIMKACAYDPAQRYQTPEELYSALDDLKNGRSGRIRQLQNGVQKAGTDKTESYSAIAQNGRAAQNVTSDAENVRKSTVQNTSVQNTRGNKKTSDFQNAAKRKRGVNNVPASSFTDKETMSVVAEQKIQPQETPSETVAIRSARAVEARKRRRRKKQLLRRALLAIVAGTAILMMAAVYYRVSTDHAREGQEDNPIAILDDEKYSSTKSGSKDFSKALDTIKEQATTITDNLNSYDWVGTEGTVLRYLRRVKTTQQADGNLDIESECMKALVYPAESGDGVYEEYFYWGEKLFFAYIWYDETSEYYYYNDGELIRWIDSNGKCHDNEKDNEEFVKRGEKYWNNSLKALKEKEQRQIMAMYQIECAYTCHTGNIRANNEDNFWCFGESLPVNNEGTKGICSKIISGNRVPAMAVFDGMGGESCGEIAAFLASEEFGKFYNANKRMLRDMPEDFIDDVCEKMNQAVCRYGTEHHIWSMGSTMAMLLFTPESMFACNLGDSRIYFMDGGKLQQISTDHVFGGTAVGKAPLTQYLGLPEELQRLEPSVTEIEHKEGYRYLLCSDGVTDMLSDSEIEAILSQDMEIPEIVNDLLKNALQKGGRDNVTIVLCEVQKLDTVRRMKEWMKNLKDKK